MYRLSVPIMVNPRLEKDFDEYVARCKQAGVERIFLVVCMSIAPEEEKAENLRLLRKFLPKFEAAGFEMGVWTNSFGHGEALQHEEGIRSTDHLEPMLMVDIEGKKRGHSFCPLNEQFSGIFCRWLQDIARAGARTIMLDDDFRVSWRGNKRFCACDVHMQRLQEELGEPVTREFMKEQLESAEPSRYRDAWLKVQGGSLLEMAQKLRAALDEVDPTVKLGQCCMISTWDTDGMDAITLSRAFAGQNPAFLRTVGAPYWAAGRGMDGIRLSYVCECERMQHHWCEGEDLELFTEGDPYPRPRESVPAAFLEGFDTALRVAGSCHGILKYMFDYISSPHFETGYLEEHELHKPLYEQLHAHFDGKKSIGVTVFQPMKTFSLSHEAILPWEDRNIPASLRFACDCGLPIRHDAGDEATIVFGDAGELADDAQFAHGAILDVTAAAALTRRGFDVGLKCVGKRVRPAEEYFPVYDEDVGIAGGDWYELDLNDGTEVLSFLCVGKKCFPAAYYYENAKGQRFLVYAFKAQTAFEHSSWEHGIFRSKCRTRQVHELLPRLMGKPLTVDCSYGLDLYVQAKTDGKSISVALWNFSEDYNRHQTVQLPGGKNIAWAAGSGTLANGLVQVDTIPPFGMAAFTVEL